MLDKGKGVDPREYGEPIIEIGGPSNALQHLPVPKGELDVVAQQAELSFWDMARKSPSAPHLTTELDAVPKSTPKATSADTKKLETPKVVPQAQEDHIRAITTKYKGNKRVREAPKSKRSKNRKRRNHHSRSKDQSRKQTSKLKPVAPTVYKGEPIVATFNRWMRESVNFLEDAQVEPSKQIRMVARYTEGKAHTYYLNVIADHEEEWSLEDYFRDIFDACFPSNFCESQRRRLYRFRRDTLTVKEYVAELTEIVDLVGDISPRERVVKFFKGLNFELQIAVRRRGLSPEVSSWDEILDEALREESVQAALRLSSRAYNASDHRNETRESTPGRRENHARRRAGDFRGRRGEQMSSTGTTPVPEKNTQTSGSSGRSRAPFGRDSRLSTIGMPKETAQLSREEKARLRTENKCFIYRGNRSGKG
ncbi:hypothetical protein PLEOSDRAFT_1087106 [Pleurotus ostreatus PC15]|uniref:Retrotransposon gag domain-containing protein n=1 Tax=Pleurotus ostreatus (strain PC15) TaxID=1137138 RepID=A0A067N3Q4_PLEO1|nr:hypothetical protein PLEOSDRAFT_1087106 [Pleurotus ostreatus PC15]